ncbi:MAG: hypothetical protein RDV48_09700 [Candidatus Eremiobacteraeota bacterium]|nr:hypothetical protein [Candidatus Eremiobacteraeota bacterium]
MRSITLLLVTLVGALVISALPLKAQDTPSAVYMAIQNAIQKGDLKELNLHTTKAKKAEFDAMAKKPGYSEQQLVAVLKAFMPTTLKIDGQKISGSRAVLELSGTGPDMMKPGAMTQQYGRALFLKEDGAWKMQQEHWNNQPFDQWKESDKALFRP